MRNKLFISLIFSALLGPLGHVCAAAQAEQTRAANSSELVAQRVRVGIGYRTPGPVYQERRYYAPRYHRNYYGYPCYGCYRSYYYTDYDDREDGRSYRVHYYPY